MESSVSVAPPKGTAQDPSPLRYVDALGVPDDAIRSTLRVPDVTLVAFSAVNPDPAPTKALDVSVPVFGLKYSLVEETDTAVSFPDTVAADSVG